MGKVRIIGITGGSGSGKTTVVRKVSEITDRFVYISQDNYYKSASYVNNSNITAFNFDRPDAFDTDLLCSQLRELKKGNSIEMPQYDYVSHSRMTETVHIDPAPVIIIDGLMVLYDPRLRDLMDLKIFVDTPADIRFIRRLQRDINERGRTVESVIKQYMEVVRPGHYEFIEPSKEYADIIIPEGGYNENALKVLSSYIREVIS